MPTSHFHYVYILWDATTHTHFYVGHTSDLAARLKTHNAGHVPHTSKFAPWEIHSAIAVQTEEQASELEKYFKSHSGREWVIKHLGLPMGMTSLSSPPKDQKADLSRRSFSGDGSMPTRHGVS